MSKFLVLFILSSKAIANTSTIELDKIEIRSSKEKKNLKNINNSIYILKEDSISVSSKENNIDAVNGISNVTSNKEEETFTIRGVKNIGVTGYQKDNLASVLVDNIFQSDLALKAGSFNLFDLQSLEIYRGPQSTTQGVNSLAGSLNINHTNPSIFNHNKIFTEMGSTGKLNTGIVFNSELIPEKLTTKITGSYQNNDGHIKNLATNNTKWAQKTYYNGNIDLLYLLQNESYVKMTNKYFRSSTGGNYVSGKNPFEYQVNENQDSNILTTNAQAGIEYFGHINDVFTNTLQINYSNSKQTTNTDSDLTELDKTGTRKDYHRDNFVSLENLIHYKSGQIKNVTGIHLHRYGLIDNYNFNVLWNNASPVTLNIKQYVDRKRETYAIFDSYDYALNDKHNINLGLRYEYVVNNYSTNVSGAKNASTGNTATDLYLDNYIKGRSGIYGGENTNGKLLPKIGYTYIVDNHSLGATISEGYRTGGVSINRYRTTAVNYRPESTINYEISYKGQIDQTRIAQNIFFSDWKNQQVQISLSKDIYDTQVENATSSKYYGSEFEITHSVSDKHELSGSIGYVNTEFNSFIKDGKNYSGKQFPNAPKWTTSIQHGFEILNNLTIKTAIRHLSNSYADAENTKLIKDQTYADLAATYDFEGYSTELKVKNIFDKRYIMNSFTNTYGSYYQMSTPRELSLQLNAVF